MLVVDQIQVYLQEVLVVESKTGEEEVRTQVIHLRLVHLKDKMVEQVHKMLPVVVVQVVAVEQVK